MNKLLVIAPTPDLAKTLQSGLDAADYKLIPRSTVEEAEPLLVHGLVDLCVLDVETLDVQMAWTLERLRRRNARLPILVYTGAKQSDWEEAAYLAGAALVLSKPVRLTALPAILERLLTAPSTKAAPQPPLPATCSPAPLPAEAPITAPSGASPALTGLRDFASLLTHSLDAPALLRDVLLQLRETLGLNRGVLLLLPAESCQKTEPGERSLSLVAALGTPAALGEHFKLSLEVGLGALVRRLGRIIRLGSAEVLADRSAQQEFEILGGRVAIPIMDRDMLLGVAVLDGRLTGEPFSNAELECVFNLLSQAARGVRNIWTHDQLAQNHGLLAGALRELGNACIVVDKELRLAHINKLARKFLGQTTRATGDLEFADLPPELGAKVFQVLRTGAAVAPFRYEPEKPAGSVFNVSVIPLHSQGAGTPESVLVTLDDLTQSEQMRRLELEASSLRQLKTTAESLVREIGNATVPLATSAQLLAESPDRKTIQSLLPALTDSVQRVTRLTDQLRYLAGATRDGDDHIPIAKLLEQASQQASRPRPGAQPDFKVEATGNLKVRGDQRALAFALAEILRNAIQATPTAPQITIRVANGIVGNNGPAVCIETEDNGPGFTLEAAQGAGTPYFTTKVPGTGLGLAVAKRIIEAHGGRLEVPVPEPGRGGLVRVYLPADHDGNGQP